MISSDVEFYQCCIMLLVRKKLIDEAKITGDDELAFVSFPIYIAKYATSVFLVKTSNIKDYFFVELKIKKHSQKVLGLEQLNTLMASQEVTFGKVADAIKNLGGIPPVDLRFLASNLLTHTDDQATDLMIYLLLQEVCNERQRIYMGHEFTASPDGAELCCIVKTDKGVINYFI